MPLDVASSLQKGFGDHQGFKHHERKQSINKSQYPISSAQYPARMPEGSISISWDSICIGCRDASVCQRFRRAQEDRTRLEVDQCGTTASLLWEAGERGQCAAALIPPPPTLPCVPGHSEAFLRARFSRPRNAL